MYAYYANDEFLRDFYKQKESYNVMIFSNMIYGSIVKNSNLGSYLLCFAILIIVREKT